MTFPSTYSIHKQIFRMLDLTTTEKGFNYDQIVTHYSRLTLYLVLSVCDHKAGILIQDINEG